RIQVQPLEVLSRRGILESTLRHELMHAVINAVSGSRCPRWLAEGMAIRFAGEARLLQKSESRERIPVAELEKQLEHPESPSRMRTLYGAAYREATRLIEKDGERAVWRRMAE